MIPQQQQQQQRRQQPPSSPTFQRSGFDNQPRQTSRPTSSANDREFPNEPAPLRNSSSLNDLDIPLVDTDDGVKKPTKRVLNKNSNNSGSNGSDRILRNRDNDDEDTKPRSAPSDRARRDEEIDSQWVQYISLEGNMGVKRLSSVLQSIDRSQYFLIEVNSRVDPPICKLVSKKELYQQAKALKQAKKANEQSSKELQLNWGTDPHDLEHKLAKFKAMLEKGHRLEIQINGKRGRNTTPEEREAVLEKVKAEFEPIAKYVKQPEWVKPTTVTMILHGIGNKAKK
ncbi:hypothetical protein BGX31_006930 [Mortierella sp. GBA43]|nr:hypothetical protein BGX31_006930 [Mortierella sp. GBA43]